MKRLPARVTDPVIRGAAECMHAAYMYIYSVRRGYVVADGGCRSFIYASDLMAAVLRQGRLSVHRLVFFRTNLNAQLK